LITNSKKQNFNRANISSITAVRGKLFDFDETRNAGVVDDYLNRALDFAVAIT
jgi:hypothetical protein